MKYRDIEAIIGKEAADDYVEKWAKIHTEFEFRVQHLLEAKGPNFTVEYLRSIVDAELSEDIENITSLPLKYPVQFLIDPFTPLEDIVSIARKSLERSIKRGIGKYNVEFLINHERHLGGGVGDCFTIGLSEVTD